MSQQPDPTLPTAPMTSRTQRGGASSGRLYLVIIGEGLDAAYPLPERGHVAIGRAPDSDVRIDHPSVSRAHARLAIDDVIRIEDLGSVNGTRLRDRPLRAREPAELGLGEPFDIGSVMVVVQRRGAPAAAAALGQAEAAPAAATPISVADTALPDLERIVQRIAAGSISVLITGETGVGKEVLSERIHRLSRRADKPLLRLNCAALSEALLETELFGHERGAFTGAVQAKAGLLETADGGTVFLDEIGELPMATQVKLLRVLEERQVLRVGALRPRSIDVRFIAATHRDLEAEITRGTFRQDLYFRLNGVTLVIPPLRERVAEIPGLAAAFLRKAAARDGIAQVPGVSPEALALMASYGWPGNIRELRNVMERALLLGNGQTIEVAHLPVEKMRARAPTPPPVAPAPPPPPVAPVAPVARDPEQPLDTIEDERARVIEALRRARGNQTEAAKLLGVSRRTLISRVVTYGLPRPRTR